MGRHEKRGGCNRSDENAIILSSTIYVSEVSAAARHGFETLVFLETRLTGSESRDETAELSLVSELSPIGQGEGRSQRPELVSEFRPKLIAGDPCWRCLQTESRF